MIAHRDDQTIIAQCTPKGSGALALIRITGDTAVEVATNISKLASGKKLSNLQTHTIHFGWVIKDEQKNIDQVMFFLMRGPKTFTGQDTVEITCHNNQFLIEEIVAEAIRYGARVAENGEFSKRAYLHKKIDLVQAEAINELIHASTQLSLKQSLAQLDGSFSSWIQSIEKELVKCLALSDASFEFIDEEDLEFGNQITERIQHLLAKTTEIKKTFNQQQQIRQGIKIALLGSVNAGKSSLFNALLNKNRAIVTEIAGTTRDSIEAGLYKNGNYITLIDTAGLRKTENIIERQGIERSLQEAESADIILLIYDVSRAMTRQEISIYNKLLKKYPTKTILVENKTDLPSIAQKLYHPIPIKTSGKEKQNIGNLESVIDKKIQELFNTIESPFLLNQRQFNLLMGLEQKLEIVIGMLQDNPAYEIISYHLKDALENISELTGKTISEQGMDAVFREFCVGK